MHRRQLLIIYMDLAELKNLYQVKLEEYQQAEQNNQPKTELKKLYSSLKELQYKIIEKELALSETETRLTG